MSEQAKSDTLMHEIEKVFDELLIEAMYFYRQYPNNYRKTAEEYFKQEIELQKKIKKYLSNR